MLKYVAAAAAATALIGLAACDSAERAGEDMDNQLEETFQGERDLGDGPFENTGEAIDEMTGQERTDDPADAVHDAVDDATENN